MLRQYPALVGEFVLRWNRGDYLAYKAAGWLGSLNGTFCLGRYDDQGSVELERELKIPYTGRVRITYGECSYSL